MRVFWRPVGQSVQVPPGDRIYYCRNFVESVCIGNHAYGSEALSAFLVTFLLIGILSPYVVGPGAGVGAFTAFYLPLALIIAAVSAATAPAAILAIVHEYRSKGPLTMTLLGVVALDDAVAVILYAFAGSIVRTITEASGFSVYGCLSWSVLWHS